MFARYCRNSALEDPRGRWHRRSKPPSGPFRLSTDALPYIWQRTQPACLGHCSPWGPTSTGGAFLGELVRSLTMEDGLRLTTVTGLLSVVTPLSLCERGGLASLVLGDLVQLETPETCQRWLPSSTHALPIEQVVFLTPFRCCSCRHESRKPSHDHAPASPSTIIVLSKANVRFRPIPSPSRSNVPEPQSPIVLPIRFACTPTILIWMTWRNGTIGEGLRCASCSPCRRSTKIHAPSVPSVFHHLPPAPVSSRSVAAAETHSLPCLGDVDHLGGIVVEYFLGGQIVVFRGGTVGGAATVDFDTQKSQNCVLLACMTCGASHRVRAREAPQLAGGCQERQVGQRDPCRSAAGSRDNSLTISPDGRHQQTCARVTMYGR